MRVRKQVLYELVDGRQAREWRGRHGYVNNVNYRFPSFISLAAKPLVVSSAGFTVVFT